MIGPCPRWYSCAGDGSPGPRVPACRPLTRSAVGGCSARRSTSVPTRRGSWSPSPRVGQLRKVMEQRAYTRIGKDVTRGGGEISEEKVAEVVDVVCTQVRLAQELGAEAIRIVATAAIRKAANGEDVAAEIERVTSVPVDVLSDHRGGAPCLHRRDEGARPPGRGRDRRRRRRRRLVGGVGRHDRRRRPRGQVVRDRLRGALRGPDHRRSARPGARSASCASGSRISSPTSNSMLPTRPSPSAAARRRCGGSSAPSSSTRRSSGASAS